MKRFKISEDEYDKKDEDEKKDGDKKDDEKKEDDKKEEAKDDKDKDKKDEKKEEKEKTKEELEQEKKDSGKGLYFKVKEEGNNLSIGEKQLVCIVRAILRRNKIVILDEATANIDVVTEQRI